MISKKTYTLLIGITAFTIGLGMVFYHFVEGLNWVDALYFCVITLTTVGYGDFSPETTLGKMFTIFYIIFGIGIITGFITATVNRQRHRIEKRVKNRSK